MCKKITEKAAVLLAAAACAGLCSCAVTDWIAPTTETVTTTTTVSERRTVDTTKTARYDNTVDDDDEDIEGYSTTTSLTGGTLENEYEEPDLYDENVRATMTTTERTYYTTPERTTTTTAASTKKTTTTTKKTETTTTKFNADALYPLTEEMKYSSDVKFKVVSDTTYLNLRFGPSKKYSVQLQIPDGADITGKGETKDADGNIWVYTSYNGTAGWVMKGLLEKK